MALPSNFSTPPGEEPHRYFRNICLDFIKKIKSSKDIDELQVEMERFLSASKEMDWHHKNTGVYHKDEGNKAVWKVWTEFKRYVMDLSSSNPHPGNPEDLLMAVQEVQRLVDSFKVT